LKGGYNAWKDAGYPISYQKNGITFIQGASLFDLVDPIKPELGQELTIEGYYGGGDSFMFIGITDNNQVLWNHINLKGVNHRGLDHIVRLQGKIIEVRDGIGDMKVNAVEILPGDIRSMIDTVDAHWKDFGAELLKSTNSSHPDGAVGSPLFDQRTHEVILYRNVGNMVAVSSPIQFAGERYYVPEVNVYYFLNLDGKITKIFLQYRQLK
jgi:hypothetical protein